MTEQKPIRVLFCIAVLQNFFDLPFSQIGPVWKAFGTMMKAPRPYLWLGRICALICLVMAGSANAVLGVIVMSATYVLFVRREVVASLRRTLARFARERRGDMELEAVTSR